MNVAETLEKDANEFKLCGEDWKGESKKRERNQQKEIRKAIKRTHL